MVHRAFTWLTLLPWLLSPTLTMALAGTPMFRTNSFREALFCSYPLLPVPHPLEEKCLRRNRINTTPTTRALNKCSGASAFWLGLYLRSAECKMTYSGHQVWEECMPV